MTSPNIQISPYIRDACPDIRLGLVETGVKVSASPGPLLELTGLKLSELQSSLTIDGIHDIQPLSDARSAYRKLGKDPSRYRPSAEALLRRVVQGKGLYRVNNVVDALNLVSVLSGFSIGGYDMDHIRGTITLGVGEEDEPYEAIGRGALNIHHLPVLRDEAGAFGSPTSDSARTRVRPETTRFLAVFFDFGKNKTLEASVKLLKTWLQAFAA